MQTMSPETQHVPASNSMKMARMMKRSPKRRIVIGSAIVAVGITWYLFRPELLFVNSTVNETLPMAVSAMPVSNNAVEPMTLAQGMFHNGAHETKGTATIHQLSGGKRILRLTDFETSNGPDVHVYLVAAKDAADSETVKSAGFVDLGSMKGNIGDQNYDVPSDLDLNIYRAATIWCARFGVNFGTAPLK